MKPATARSGTTLLQRMRETSLDTRILVLLIALSLTRGILYALVNPPFSSPDEKGHYDYVASFFQNEGAAAAGAERKQPSLYYWLTLPAFSLFAGQPSDYEVYALAANHVSLSALLAVRVMSVIMSTATVPLAYWTARGIFPKDRFVYLGTAAFVALLPGYGWIGSSINNDNLAILTAGALILLLAHGISNGFTPARILVLIVLGAAALNSKATTLPVVATVPAVLATGAAVRMLGGRPRARLAAVGGLTVVALAVVATPLRSSAASLAQAALRGQVKGNIFSGDRFAGFLSHLDAWPFVYQFKSFWGSFYDDSVQLPQLAYWVLALICAASLAGLAIQLSRMIHRKGNAARRSTTYQVLVMLALVVMEWSISFVRFYGARPLIPSERLGGWDEDFAIMQGRFLYPVMIPIGFLIFWGMASLVPERWRRHGTAVAIALLMTLDWLSLMALINGGYSWTQYAPPQ